MFFFLGQRKKEKHEKIQNDKVGGTLNCTKSSVMSDYRDNLSIEIMIYINYIQSYLL